MYEGVDVLLQAVCQLSVPSATRQESSMTVSMKICHNIKASSSWPVRPSEPIAHIGIRGEYPFGR